jgi:hypothetical protein
MPRRRKEGDNPAREAVQRTDDELEQRLASEGGRLHRIPPEEPAMNGAAAPFGSGAGDQSGSVLKGARC